MRIRKMILLLPVLIVALLFVVSRYASAKPPGEVTKQRWEYCLVLGSFPQGDANHYKAQIILPGTPDGKFDEIESSFEGVAALNKLGAEGWEIVGVIPTQQSDRTEYLLKRAKP